MNDRQRAHTWAQQPAKQPANGRSNLIPDGDTIYSYGRHFPIARFVDSKTVLFTNRDYSVSTACHKSYVRQAIPASVEIFYCYDPEATTKEAHCRNFERMKEDAKAMIQASLTARGRKAELIGKAIAIINRANQYAARFKIGKRIRWDESKLAETLAEEQRKSAAKQHHREQKERDRAAVVLVDWLNGGSEFPRNDRIDGIRFRIRGDNLQSTLGAEFPVEHAKRAWPLLQRIRATGETWHRNGQTIHLGHFQIDSVDTNGDIVAGCHRVKWEEVVRVAQLIGVAQP